MADTIISQLADFAHCSSYQGLPGEVVTETRRIVLDSIGCALAGGTEEKGRIGIDYGRLVGGGNHEATIMGTPYQVAVSAASFANAELVNCLDMDCVVPPGHVTPYVLPGALAIGESLKKSGRDLITALAVAHEMSLRLGRAMDNLRDTKEGKSHLPRIFGYASAIFGGTAAISILRDQSKKTMEQALGIAGCVSPVNPQGSWFQREGSSTIKYLTAGVMSQQAHLAAHLAEFGHQGDTQILDDRDWGYPRFIGTSKWEPQQITADLGTKWNFPGLTSFKPYAHCRIMHASFDCIYQMVEEYELTPDEIEGIKVYVEGFAELPVWLNRKIDHVYDAQFSMAHGISMAAHRPQGGRAWMDPKLVFSRSVLDLMSRVETEVHPEYVRLLTTQGASRPAWVEIRARGTSFVREKRYPKGSPSPDPDTYMTDEELAAKFRNNAQGILSPEKIDQLVEQVFRLEDIADIGLLMRLTATS